MLFVGDHDGVDDKDFAGARERSPFSSALRLSGDSFDGHRSLESYRDDICFQEVPVAGLDALQALQTPRFRNDKTTFTERCVYLSDSFDAKAFSREEGSWIRWD